MLCLRLKLQRDWAEFRDEIKLVRQVLVSSVTEGERPNVRE